MTPPQPPPPCDLLTPPSDLRPYRSGRIEREAKPRRQAEYEALLRSQIRGVAALGAAILVYMALQEPGVWDWISRVVFGAK